MTTALGYDDRFLQHRTGTHPERPARLTTIIETLRKQPIWDELFLIRQYVEPDVWIREIHSPEYVDRLRTACQSELPFIDTPDSAICPDSYEVARTAVSVTLGACDAVMQGRCDNAFCPVRPPGHHAEQDRSMGFCLFNNIAVAARYLQKHHGLKRILILDWDAHHGNGTQHSFERDDTVFYCSLHQHPATLFPGTGWPNEIGLGAGRGFTLNLPLSPGAGDDECLDYFRTNFMPMAKEFRPDFVLVSAGFDGHHKDPLSQLSLTEASFDKMGKELMRLAAQFCKGRLISLLEGGYHLGALSSCVSRHVNILVEKPNGD